MTRRAPGPEGLPIIGNYLQLRKDILSLMVDARERYGDVVRFRIGPRVIHILSNPDHVRHVMLTRRDNYDKTARSSQQIRYLSGMSLLVSNGTDWQVKRRLLQPAFKINTVRTYFALMAELAEACHAGIAAKEPVDISSLMSQLTYRVVGLALMSDDLVETGGEVQRAMGRCLRHLYNRINHPSAPLWVPSPANIGFMRARKRLRDVVATVLRKRSNKSGVHDLLSEMISAKNSDTDHVLDDTWLRDEVVTLLLAGHETTANALTFCITLLAKHRSIQDGVYAEIEKVLGGRPLQISDIDSLRYTLCVFQESLRLYPPIWAMERFVKQNDVLDGYDIPKGSTVFISVYSMHRHPAFWQTPDRFDPERFVNGDKPAAYLPFGLGPRMCLGMNFALQEAMVILVSLLQRFELVDTQNFKVQPEPGITLRVRGAVPITLKLR